ncbi:energy transducer TonB [Shewanella sp. 1CM18E]|uniref:energy transducer TonB n=1 Tax=Shewanella sp. 1CM18E TaxID=2929169 RepID=UPI0020BEB12C|nr:energy transducer TonB [Shewanella sp. 1CM18E]MCK8046187.1 energy transducer TonB [Shewanella sp. 1CM18E]
MYQKGGCLNILRTLAIVLVASGCTSSPLSHYIGNQPIEVNSSEVAFYWFPKNNLIDWQNVVPPSNTTQQTTSPYKISFIINEDGYMSQVNVINTTNGETIDAEALKKFEAYQFNPAPQNFQNQAVKVSTTVSL